MAGADESRGSGIFVGTFRTLDQDFLQLMNEIGLYGIEKYGDESFFKNPSRSERKSTKVIGDHVANHYMEYQEGILHDHFGTLRHQLAAVAFNAMMEYYMMMKEHKDDGHSNKEEV